MRPQSILIVEDHADSASTLSRILQREGHSVKVAPTIGDARSLSNEHSFDIALCDFGLPDGDGCELVSTLSGTQPIKFIALTGYAMAEDVARAVSAGFHGYLTKPVSFDELKLLLEKVIASPLKHPEFPPMSPRQI